MPEKSNNDATVVSRCTGEDRSLRSKPWQLASWRKRRAEYLEGKRCEWCGSDKILTIHHPQPPGSLTDDQYSSFEGAMVLCKRCHFSLKKGLILCKICKARYHKPNREMCWGCFTKTPEGKEIARERAPLEYVYPWCEQVFRIRREDWEIEADVTMCCIEHCQKSGINVCMIAEKGIAEEEASIERLAPGGGSD